MNLPEFVSVGFEFSFSADADFAIPVRLGTLEGIGAIVSHLWKLEEPINVARFDTANTKDFLNVTADNVDLLPLPSARVDSVPGKIGDAANFGAIHDTDPGSHLPHVPGGAFHPSMLVCGAPTTPTLDFNGSKSFTLMGWFKSNKMDIKRGVFSKHFALTNQKQWGVFVQPLAPTAKLVFVLSPDSIQLDQVFSGTFIEEETPASKISIPTF